MYDQVLKRGYQPRELEGVLLQAVRLWVFCFIVAAAAAFITVITLKSMPPNVRLSSAPHSVSDAKHNLELSKVGHTICSFKHKFKILQEYIQVIIHASFASKPQTRNASS